MTRSVFPFYVNDISALARSLNHQIAGSDHLPGHLEMLNMLARAAGSRNFQHYRERSVEAPPPVDYSQLERLARYFDTTGRLVRWPTKFSHQEPCLWVLWSRIPPRRTLSEREINELLLRSHCFEDPALLRRELKERQMVSRTLDGREYRRIERRPTNEALALIRLLLKR